MFLQYGTEANETQTGEEESQFWAQQLESYLAPYSERLDAYLDRRVVGKVDRFEARNLHGCCGRLRLRVFVAQPLPTNGMPVAITVMNSTFASSGRLAM